MRQRRKGSILFTAIALVSVFLTLAVASVTYLDSAGKRSVNDRWRETAEQAARSGLDFVMGWAQQNIDRMSRLPTDWSNMSDGEIINPVYSYVMNQPGSVANNSLTAWNADLPGDGIGQVLGQGTNLQMPVGGPPVAPSGVGEYILSHQGRFYVTFKVRVQQFSYSENMPRQYRVGVIGRVRKVDPGNAIDVNVNERGGIVAERYLYTTVGQMPASRYAALIDIDGVKNWVPGEVVNGPVHINRGYIDSASETLGGVANGTPYFQAGLGSAPGVAGGSIDGVLAKSMRSIMEFKTNPGSPFSVVNGRTCPRFNDVVSITAVLPGDATSARYTNLDSGSTGNGVDTAVRIDGATYSPMDANANAFATQMFGAPENYVPNARRLFGGLPGPVIVDRPVILPRSVRSRMDTALGVPFGSTVSGIPGGWAPIPDGVYVPTSNFWTAGPGGANYNMLSPAGGIYVRGNIEVMRMGMEGQYSYYLFQLGYGNTIGPKRCYGIVANRLTGEMWLKAWPGAVGVPTGASAVAGLSTGDSTNNTCAGLFGAIPAAGVGGALAGCGNTTDATQYAMTGGGLISSYFPPTTGVFNGVVFVDVSQADPARDPAGSVNLLPGQTPLTGNIFALGDPGKASSTSPQKPVGVAAPFNVTEKRSIMASGDTSELVATYQGLTPSNPATRLTILATGNVFIQNSIFLQSLNTVVGYPDFADPTSQNVTLNGSKDLIGIVADKQVVLGLFAPSRDTPAARNLPGTIIHASIAALGDPGFDYATGQAKRVEMTPPDSYRGSFATEGLMQYYSTMTEEYNVCNGAPNVKWGINPGETYRGYPGTPLYMQNPASWNLVANFFANPNGLSTRGQAIVFGSVTVKKRGILGKGDTSFDKRFVFDRRLLTIAPPVFPTSTNVIVNTSAPSSPDNLPYRPMPAAAVNALPLDRRFML